MIRSLDSQKLPARIRLASLRHLQASPNLTTAIRMSAVPTWLLMPLETTAIPLVLLESASHGDADPFDTILYDKTNAAVSTE